MQLRTIIIFVTIITGSLPTWGASYATAGRISISDVGTYQVDLDYSWPTAEPSYIFLPCSIPRTRCFLGISVTLDEPDNPRGYRPYAPDALVVTYMSGELLTDVRDRFIKQFRAQGHVTIKRWRQIKPGYDEYFHTALACFQYWDTPPTVGGSPSEMLYGKNLPESSCGKLTPPNPPTTNCGSLPSMVFDFGVTVPGSASGSQLHKQQNLQCNNATEVTFKLSSTLQLSRALEARMSVNGQTLDTTGVTLRTGGANTPLDFGVTIYGNEGTGGEYTSSSVLIMEYR